jgi:hypothetical protein
MWMTGDILGKSSSRRQLLIPDGLGRGVVARMAEWFADDEKHAAPAIGSW